MSEQEILEGNQLIAEFMGINKGWSDFPYIVHGDSWKLEGLKYQKSWDWLMPVVDKIEDFTPADNHFHVVIVGYVCLIQDTYKKNIIDSPAESKINATWLAVVKFVKWHNEQVAK